jgi:tetratricopeptide (TPR) repeat protein
MSPVTLVLVLAGSLLGTPAPPARALADGGVPAVEHRSRDERPERYVALATDFMHQARTTGDPAYYGRAAAALDRALALDPTHYPALRARAWVLLGQHDFRAAGAAADAAREREPADWWNYATLTDARVELGDYDGATVAAQRMVDLRPGLPAYTRVAFLRSLYGDRAGALEMLARAARTADPHDPESLAWTLVHLGHEHFAAGALAPAATAYTAALDALPDYYLALAGLARVRAAGGNLDAAIDLYRRAVARIPAPDLVAALGDLYRAADRGNDAEQQYALVEYMGRVAAAQGTTYGRQLALFFADHARHLPEALQLARQEATTRDDIYTCDALAWALYANGRAREAMRASHRALRLGTEDALLHYHAGMIAVALGRSRRAARDLGRALAINPYFDLHQAEVARTTLAQLAPPTRLARRDVSP